MASVIEDPKSRSIKFGARSVEQTRVYSLVGYTDSDLALAALINNAPTSVTVRGVVLSAAPEYSVDPVSLPTDPSQSVHLGRVQYKTPELEQEDSTDPQQPEDPASLSFDFGAISDIKFEDPNQETYIDLSGDPTSTPFTAINQPDPDLPAQGQEYNAPVATFQVKVVQPESLVTNKWLKDRMDQVWTLNSTTFRSLPARSVALTGLSGNQRSDGHWDITYSFEYRPSRPEQTLGMAGNQIKVPATTGWQYVWAEYTQIETRTKDNTKTGNNSNEEQRTWRELNRVHVADLYEASDFGKLGINE